MKHRAGTAARVPIRGKGWKRTRTIDAEKYAAVSRAILGALGPSPIAFGELVERVGKRLAGFSGSVPWYTMSCLRELEVRGEIERRRGPVRYARRTITSV